MHEITFTMLAQKMNDIYSCWRELNAYAMLPPETDKFIKSARVIRQRFENQMTILRHYPTRQDLKSLYRDMVDYYGKLTGYLSVLYLTFEWDKSHLVPIEIYPSILKDEKVEYVRTVTRNFFSEDMFQ